jgi:bifunctional non-homologous end joining protein LigD
MARLPEFIPPMLCKLGEAFDSDAHVYEIKWDGTRSLAFIEDGDYRLLNRKRRDQKARYPELAFMAELPDGCVLDGEIVIITDGKPDFGGMLVREQAQTPAKIAAVQRSHPAVYVAFDLLYHGGRDLMRAPLEERRAALEALVQAQDEARLVFSEGIVAGGLAFFEHVKAEELEGMVAKSLGSRYLPGQRTELWTKHKLERSITCAIIGFVPERDDDFKSLIIAAEEGGQLRCVGRVGGGIDAVMRRRLCELLYARLRSEPLIECSEDGLWVEPGLLCEVKFLEHTRAGGLRAPVFQALLQA